MIKVKHIFDDVEKDDGQRIWVEPVGLTRDLRDWCKVNDVLPQLGPPTELWAWFEEHPMAYDIFRGKYHKYLSDGPHGQLLVQLARTAMKANITLLHTGDDPVRNCAVALHEYLSELEAYLQRE